MTPDPARPTTAEPRYYAGHPLTEVWQDGTFRIEVVADAPWVLLWYDGNPFPPGHAMTAKWAAQLRDALTKAIEVCEDAQRRREPS